MTQTDPTTPTVRVIDGRECTDRAGIAVMAGWKAGNSVNVRAKTDPEFPAPIRSERIDRGYWYPLDAVDAYLVLLAERREAGKPPAIEPGDPDELLGPDEAAQALHLSRGSFDSYVRWSKPYWSGASEGRPLLPPPDDSHDDQNAFGEFVRRQWRRGTLAAHQAGRPGITASTGRPRTVSEA